MKTDASARAHPVPTDFRMAAINAAAARRAETMRAACMRKWGIRKITGRAAGGSYMPRESVASGMRALYHSGDRAERVGAQECGCGDQEPDRGRCSAQNPSRAGRRRHLADPAHLSEGVDPDASEWRVEWHHFPGRSHTQRPLLKAQRRRGDEPFVLT